MISACRSLLKRGETLDPVEILLRAKLSALITRVQGLGFKV